MKRAGLDYWEHVKPRIWESWEAIERQLPDLGEPWFFSTKGKRLLWDAPLGDAGDVVLVFGSETAGLPASIVAAHADRLLAMPIQSPHVRSLNLSTAVGIALYEVLRQRIALL